MDMDEAIKAIRAELERIGSSCIVKSRLGLICIGDHEDHMDVRLEHIDVVLRELRRAKKGGGDDAAWYALAGVPDASDDDDDDDWDGGDEADTATIATITHGTGLVTLHCPGCGTAIMTDDEGLLDRPKCSHLRFIYDWAGEAHYFGPKKQQSSLRACLEELEEDDLSIEDLVESVAAELPPSALVILSMPQEGADASPMFAAFDLAAACGAG